jgi:hypothetical protein
MPTDRKTATESLEMTTDVIVTAMYRDFDDGSLAEMLIHGEEFPPEPIVVALNRSIQKELHRRKQEREDLEADR